MVYVNCSEIFTIVDLTNLICLLKDMVTEIFDQHLNLEISDKKKNSLKLSSQFLKVNPKFSGIVKTFSTTHHLIHLD